MTPSPARNDSRGQVVVILVWMVAALAILLVLCFNIFLSGRGKSHLMSAGDAAALAAARWQGNTLNLIGDLNLAHLAAACDQTLSGTDRTNVIHGVNALAARLAFAGPTMGFHAANVAARRNFDANRAPDAPPTIDHGMESLVAAEITFARNNGDILNDDPLWRTKATDYANMLQTVLSDGLFVGADNARQIARGATGDHIYYNKGFYSAVSSRTWQWFCRACGRNHQAAISSLNRFSKPSGDDLEATSGGSVHNAGFFGIGVRPLKCALRDVSPRAADALLDAWNAYNGGSVVTRTTIADLGVIDDAGFEWWFYDPEGEWRPWNELAVGSSGQRALVSAVRPEFDVYGAEAACRVVGDIPTADSVTNRMVWRSAAKPFGSLPGTRRVTEFFGPWNGGVWDNAPLVMPSFSFTRLITLGAVGTAHLNRADPAWVGHLDHVRANLRRPDCRYCQLLDAWEAGLHHEGARWLSEHPHEDVCAPPGKGGHSYDDDEYNN